MNDNAETCAQDCWDGGGDQQQAYKSSSTTNSLYSRQLSDPKFSSKFGNSFRSNGSFQSFQNATRPSLEFNRDFHDTLPNVGKSNNYISSVLDKVKSVISNKSISNGSTLRDISQVPTRSNVSRGDTADSNQNWRRSKTNHSSTANWGSTNQQRYNKSTYKNDEHDSFADYRETYCAPKRTQATLTNKNLHGKSSGSHLSAPKNKLQEMKGQPSAREKSNRWDGLKSNNDNRSRSNVTNRSNYDNRSKNNNARSGYNVSNSRSNLSSSRKMSAFELNASLKSKIDNDMRNREKFKDSLDVVCEAEKQLWRSRDRHLSVVQQKLYGRYLTI